MNENRPQRFAKDEPGITAIEYGLIAALIAVVIISAVPPCIAWASRCG